MRLSISLSQFSILAKRFACCVITFSKKFLTKRAFPKSFFPSPTSFVRKSVVWVNADSDNTYCCLLRYFKKISNNSLGV